MAALAHSLVNKFLHPPTVKMKELASDEDGSRYAESLRLLFGLNGSVADEPNEADGPGSAGPHDSSSQISSPPNSTPSRRD